MVQQLVAPDGRSHTGAKRMSLEEFRAWAIEDVRAEWVDGEVIELRPPDERHQDLAVFLTTLLNLFVVARRLGKVLSAPFEMRLREGASYREPDLMFVAADHLDRLDGKRLTGPADVVIEIVSDESAARDRRDKFVDYAVGGVAEYWIVDPRLKTRGTKAYALTDEGYYEEIPRDDRGRIHSNVLSGFGIDPKWIESDPLPNPLETLAEIDADHFQERSMSSSR